MMPATVACTLSVGEKLRPDAASPPPAGLDHLRQAEVENLHRTVGRDLDVRRLEVAVDHAPVVGSLERIGNLAGYRQSLFDRKPASATSHQP